MPVSFACKQLEGMEAGMKQAQLRFAKQTDELVGYYVKQKRPTLRIIWPS